MRTNREDIDRWFDYGVHPGLRTIYLGGWPDGDADDAGIDYQMADAILKALTVLDNGGDKPITIHMNCRGGDWEHGIAIYDRIRACRCHVDIIAWGKCYSMAPVVLQAADTRILAPHTVVMVHDGHLQLDGDCKSMERWAKRSAKERAEMYRIFGERMGRTGASVERLCSHDTIFTAGEAVEIGLADRVLD